MNSFYDFSRYAKGVIRNGWKTQQIKACYMLVIEFECPQGMHHMSSEEKRHKSFLACFVSFTLSPNGVSYFLFGNTAWHFQNINSYTFHPGEFRNELQAVISACREHVYILIMFVVI